MKSKNKKPNDERSLYTTLIVTFVTLSVISLLFSGILLLVSNLRTQSVVVSDTQQLIARQAARDVSNFIQDKFSVLETAVWLTDPIVQSSEEQKLILDSLLGLQPAFRQLVIFDSQHQPLAQASRLPLESPEHFLELISDEEMQNIREGKKFISSVYLDPYTGEPLTVMAMPALDVFDEYQGLILAETNLKYMWDLVENLKVGERGHAYVVDRNGSLLAYADTTLVLKGIYSREIELVNEFMNSSSTAIPDHASTYWGIEKELVVGSYVPLIMPDWAVITELPWDEAYQPVINNMVLALLIIAVVAILAAMVGSNIARQLAAPLVNLMETASEITAGNRTLQADVSGPIEVASLALAFNDMTSQLQQSLTNLEQKVSERTQQLQETLNFQEKILATSATGIIAYDETGQCALVNEAAARLVDGTTEQLLAQNYHDIDAWKQYGLYEIAVEAHTQKKETEKEMFLITTYGKEAWFACSFTTFESEGRTHLLLTFNDMTEHKRVEQEILNLNQRLQTQADNLTAANKELEAFSYSVSHDLRAPLRAIHGFTNILIDDYVSNLDDEGRRICDVIQDNASRMSLLIDDLLSFSRLNRAEINASPIDMTAMVTSVYQELASPEDQQRILFETNSLPMALGDPMLMHQVWVNLISNAIKFSSRQQQPHIEISGYSNDSEIIYSIKDNGAGFDMQYAGKLFGVFQRLHSEREFEGTGVGLAIIQRILHRHGGRIWGEGEVDKGAIFHFTLPRKENLL
ncbi:MAG: HAMP domain-containing protein [Anaerolineales bacterium]|nr:HAMP domain-containing protein [Anaerolineales bacterium]